MLWKDGTINPRIKAIRAGDTAAKNTIFNASKTQYLINDAFVLDNKNNISPIIKAVAISIPK